MAQNDFATNGNDGMLMFQNTRWSIGTEWRLGYHDVHGYETETHIGTLLNCTRRYIICSILCKCFVRLPLSRIDRSNPSVNLFDKISWIR